VNVADGFSDLQMYIVFEFEDSGRDLESVEVSKSLCSWLILIMQHSTYDSKRRVLLHASHPDSSAVLYLQVQVQVFL